MAVEANLTELSLVLRTVHALSISEFFFLTEYVSEAGRQTFRLRFKAENKDAYKILKNLNLRFPRRGKLNLWFSGLLHCVMWWLDINVS